MAATFDTATKPLAPGLTIGVPCFRCAATIEESLNSLFQATPAGMAVEFILKEDSHAPGSPKYEPRDAESRAKLIEVCEKARARGINIRIIGSDGNVGVSAGRNEVLRQAKYDTVFFFDADDRLPKGSRLLENSVAALRADPNLAYTYPMQRVFGDVRGVPWIPRFDERRLLLQGHAVPCITARTQDMRDAGGYNEAEGLHEDQEMCIRLLGHFHETGRTPTAKRMDDLYDYRVVDGDGSLMNREGGHSNKLIRHFTYLTQRNKASYLRIFGTSNPTALADSYKWQALPIETVRFCVNLANGTRPFSHIKRHVRRFIPIIGRHIK